jgi:hypothetical protein
MKKNLLLLLIVFAFAGCSKSDDELLNKLQTEVEKEAGKTGYHTVSMESLTDFEWDVMYFFEGDVEVEEIENEIGFKWDGSTIPGGHNRLLFVHQNQVVNYIDYNTEEFPLRVFGCNTDRWVYPRRRSTFATFKYCQNNEEVYAFIPVPCLENIRELMDFKCDERAKAE